MIRVKRSGLLYILFSILLGVAATNTGNNFLFVITSLILGFMGASGFFGRNNLSGIEAEIKEPREVYAKTPFFLRIRVRNTKRFMPSFLLRLKVGKSEISLPLLQPYEEKEIDIPFICERRGVFRIESIELSSVFPLNLFRRFNIKKCELSFIVFPEPKKTNLSYGFLGEVESDSQKLEKITSSEISGLRDYNLRDPLKLIHWKASAKIGRLKTKKLESDRKRELFIDFENFPLRDVEERIKVVTHIVIEATRRGVPVGISINGKRIEPSAEKSNKYRILRELALYGIG